MQMKLLANAFLACMAAISCTPQEKLCDYVDPMIGTAHSRWFFFTPAAVPFGMAKLAPTTDGHYGNPSGWEAVGYDFRHTSIEGFASFHEFQVGGARLIPGFYAQAVEMKKGEKRTIVIPPELGYGASGIPGVIPRNAFLIFDLEILDIR